MALTLSTTARNAACDAVVDLTDGGTTDAGGDLIIMDASSNELVVITLQNPAFGNAANGTATINGTPISAIASATGTATQAKIRDRNNVDIITGLTVGTSGTDVIIENTSITSGQTVNLNSGSITMPAS